MALNPSAPPQSPRPRSRRNVRWNLALSALLVLAAVLLANLLARSTLRVRADLSADQLTGLHPATRALLARLGDVLRVEVYFTGELSHGSVQIARGRLVDQLRELEQAGQGRLELAWLDPSASSEARLAAEAAGIVPVALRGQQGTAEVTQSVYLGLILRYQGKSSAIPFVLPQGCEYAFASALAELLRERRPRVGWLAEHAGEGSGPESFDGLRQLLAERALVSEVRALETGRAVPADIDLLVVAAPEALAPRAAFEIDQYAQRGGRLLLLLDRYRIDLQKGAGGEIATGLEGCLRAWGAPLSRQLVWDLSSNDRTLKSVVGQGAGARTQSFQLQYPFWVRVLESGLSSSAAATAGLRGCDLFWASAFGPEPGDTSLPLPTGVERLALLSSSERSWLVEPPASLALDQQGLNSQSAELLASGPGRARPLAIALSGKLPSAFRETGAPAPQLPGGQTDPAPSIWQESVRSGELAAQVVAVGDADFARAGFLSERNQLLAANLVDWLLLEGELVALRARLPKERRLLDFLEQERSARGLSALRGSGSLESSEAGSLAEEQAATAAARRRWLHMGSASAGALALLAAALLARRLLARGGLA